jgi:hypothetical protein
MRLKTKLMFSQEVIATTVLSLAFFAFFIIWMNLDVDSLLRHCKEDGVIESVTAILFFVSAIGFCIVLVKSGFLKQRGTKSAYLMTLAWCLLMFVFAGEEISWGQRLIGFSTPEPLKEVNLQGEFTIHNIGIVHRFMGGQHTYLTIMMLMTGLIIPLFTMTPFGRRIFQYFAFPVAPFRYVTLFVGAYIFGKYFGEFPFESPTGISSTVIARELREFAMGVAMVCFAIHGAIRPWDLFGVDKPAESEVATATIRPVELANQRGF